MERRKRKKITVRISRTIKGDLRMKKINDFLIKNSFKENIKTEKKKIKLRDGSSLIFEKYFIIKKYNKIIETIKKGEITHV